MDETPNALPPTPEELDQALAQVHQLGSATGNFFSRLYANFTRRSQMEQVRQGLLAADAHLKQVTDQHQKLAKLVDNKQEEIDRLYRILASISEGIIMQDLSGRIVMINDAAQELLGSQKNFWQSPLGTLFNEHRHQITLSAELVPLGAPQRIETNNRILNAQLAALGNRDGERIGSIIILRDITRDALAERIKSSFVAHISHELNTPMNVMRVASEILSNQPEDSPPNRRMLELLSNNIDILDRMVEELLDVSEMTSGAFSIAHEPVNLPEIIWDVRDEFITRAAGSGLFMMVMVRDEDQLHLTGDTRRLRWALEHLVRNAVDYNERGGLIEISAGIDHSALQPQLFLRVRDTGVGISEADRPNVFELFYRGTPVTRSGKKLDPRGLGQGLYIVQTIAEAHGGSVEMESTVGRGSDFTISLPYSAQQGLTA